MSSNEVAFKEYIDKLRRPIRCSIRQMKIRLVLLRIDEIERNRRKLGEATEK